MQVVPQSVRVSVLVGVLLTFGAGVGVSAQSAATPSYKRDMLGNVVPHVRAAAAIIYDPQTGAVLWEENMHDQRSIASLTKLMTAVTFLADVPDLSQQVLVTRADVRNASVTYLRAGERISHGDLLHLTLIASDNAAARVLARTSEGGTAAFVARMNAMATSLGLTNTHYADPSGLDARNVSSAYDVSQLVAYAASDERLSPIMRRETYEVHTNKRAVKIEEYEPTARHRCGCRGWQDRLHSQGWLLPGDSGTDSPGPTGVGRRARRLHQ